MKKILVSIFSILVVLFSIHSKEIITTDSDINGKITVDGLEREYILHLPKNYGSVPLPLVMVFHGGGGSAEQIKDHVKFNKTADKENFIVVYPNSVDKNWNDGRSGSKLPDDRDDVKFINIMLDTLISTYYINSGRIFATGISNGAFFSIYLALKMSERLVAVAPVCGNIPENLRDNFKLTTPVSLLLINGTKDPLVKYEGGAVGFGDDETKRGVSISTDWTIKIWTDNNFCQNSSKIEQMEDKEDDGCTEEKITYYKCGEDSKVVLIKINGGGHTWPGASQYLPKILVGTVCKDFNANNVIWDFFSSLPPKN
ncbi:MAG: hypothetical protein IT280_09185 [Ignavibacteria bacterium]|nr:hypothetical protein [Ignavibacteria bacterium]